MCPRLLLISYTICHYNIEYIREEKRGGKGRLGEKRRYCVLLKEDMIESGVEVMKIIDTKLGAGSTHPGPLPQPAILQKFFAQLSKGRLCTII